MANEEHLKILRQGVELWNSWREGNPRPESDRYAADLSEADLQETNLSGANLSETYLFWANLREANLYRADLSEANLIGVNLSGANLREVNLSRAILSGTDLYEADLRESILSQADLNRANLSGANLSGADLSGTRPSGAILNGTFFANVDLSEVKKLDEVRHVGPSYIDIGTLYRSRGNIPEAFLRGAGVDDTFIAYIRSLSSSTYEYYSCFISYSSKDEDLAERLHADLQQHNVRAWFAPEDLKIGERIRVGIDEAIRVHDKLLLILSKHSINSDWVEQEVESAMEKERDRKALVLFPIRVDGAIMEEKVGWAAHLKRTRNIGDFSRWKEHDAYQKSLKRLLRDLKAEGN